MLTSACFSGKYLKVSFSQNGEGDFIRTRFWSEIRAGYKDCFSETLYSNTKLLSLIGINGISVGANPELIEP